MPPIAPSTELARGAGVGLAWHGQPSSDPCSSVPTASRTVHGSAPDIAGQGRANPLGQVWSAALMLDHLGHADPAAAVVAAMDHVLADTDIRTADLGGTGQYRRGDLRARARLPSGPSTGR